MATQNALTLNIQDTQTLLSAYMPALERGGIFVPTRERHELGQQVSLLLMLPGETEPVAVTGQVIWITPEGVSGRRMPGVGIHFSAADQLVRDRIEGLLAGQLDKDTPSYTL